MIPLLDNDNACKSEIKQKVEKKKNKLRDLRSCDKTEKMKV